MGVDYEIRCKVVCPKCGTLLSRDWVDIFKCYHQETGYGDDYIIHCKKCRKQLIRIRVG